jgi:uncharacterized protein YutE (UPF0331/DUF86 family)
MHEYVTLDLEWVVEAINRLGRIEGFVEIVRRMESETE